MLDYHRIWSMRGSLRGAMTVTAVEKLMREDIWHLVKGEIQPPKPVVFKYRLGRQQPKDLIETTFVGRYLLSDRIIQILRANKFSGWSTYPVKVLAKDGSEIPDYHGFAVTGRAGPPDDSRSKRISRKFLGGMTKELQGIYFDEKTWDGSDIFNLDTTAYISMTEPVHNAIVALKPGNIDFRPLDEVLSPIL